MDLGRSKKGMLARFAAKTYATKVADLDCYGGFPPTSIYRNFLNRTCEGIGTQSEDFSSLPNRAVFVYANRSNTKS